MTQRGATRVERVAPCWPVPLAVLVAGLFAWWGVWRGEFVFDDGPAIARHRALLDGDFWAAAFGSQHTPLANRPLTALSLVIDLRLFGPGPTGPHLTNLLLHLGNAVLLFAVLRRSLGTPNLGGRFSPQRAHRLAAAVALLWVVHPLATDAVAYATQRSTLLAAGALLAAIYATLRGWRAAAVAALVLGMASKEDMVVGPPLILLLDRALLQPDWAAVRRRAGFHAAAAGSWIALALCVAAGPRNATVGYATTPRLSALDWLQTQAGVLVHYLRLVVVPVPLRGAYDWDYVRSLAPAVLPGTLVLALLAAAVWLWRTRPWWGFVGAWFFLLLAPTSSVLPIATEIAAERRMYLPMLAVLVPLLAGAERLLAPRLFALVVAALTFGLALLARAHAVVYRDEPAFWADAYRKRTPGSRSHLAAQILSNHGAMLFNQGQRELAFQLFEESMACESPTVVERTQYAVMQHLRGRTAAAIEELERIVAAHPEASEALGQLGTVLLQVATRSGRPSPGDPMATRAEQVLRRAVELESGRLSFWNSLGYLLQVQERWAEAEAAYRRATELSTERVEPFLNRAEALRRLGRRNEIVPLFERLLADPRHAAQADELRRHAERLAQ